jgi:hypothetical protein
MFRALLAHLQEALHKQQLVFIVLSFGCFPRVWFILADVSENSICSIFKADDLEIICLEDGTDRMFRNVGQYKPDAGETPKRKHTEY